MSARQEASFGAAVLLFLAGPVLWFAHFMVVYLIAEVICTAAGGPRAEVAGLPLVTFLTLALTVPAVAATVALARRALRLRGGTHGELAFIGFLMGLLFAVAIVFVGVPPLFLTPC